MCTLNQWKKKLHFNKLIQFLNQYPYIIFYHSNSEIFKGTLREDLAKSDSSLGLIFLVNSARIRDLTRSETSTKKSQKFQQRGNSVTSLSTGDQKTSPNLCALMKPLENLKNLKHEISEIHKYNLNTLTWVSKGGAMGSTFLVGCKSLEAMQRVIANNDSELSMSKARNEKKMDLVCLGAIYDHSFRDHLDCLRLSQISMKAAQEKIPHTLGLSQNKLLNVLKATQNSLYFSLMAVK